MQFNEYQARTKDTAIYKGQGTILGIMYVGLGLGEAGELQNKIKKVFRDHDGQMTEEIRQSIKGEIGDTLYYLARLADECSLDFNDIAESNIAKLADRKNRGAIKGSGDNR